MTPADRRITELIDKWLTSIDLHLQYVELSDAAYARVQPWPKHDRPTRWVLEVARQKILELKSHVETRQAMGDGKFAESLELMAFLANLVGIQHIQRFVPLADPGKAQTKGETSNPSASQTVEIPPVVRAGTPKSRASGDDTTREMPRLRPAPAKRAEEAKPAQRPAPAKSSASAPTRTAAKPPAIASELRSKIIADAVRLLKWGKPWHELAELIARIADRPSAAEVRKVLRAARSEIEQKAKT
jgi:hypothetical protein